jgi:hypothetical protein
LHRGGMTAHCTGINRGKGERASAKNTLQYAASRAPGTRRDGHNRGNPNGRRGCCAQWYWRLHVPKCTSERGYSVKIC